MSLSILRFAERRIGQGNPCTEVSGIAQYNATDLTGELDCRFSNIEEMTVQGIGPGGALISHLNVVPGIISATTSFTVTVSKAGVIPAILFTTPTAVAADNTNYWTFGVVNKGQAGAGTTVVVDATAAANSTKVTGGTAIVAYTPRSLTLSVVAGATTVAVGDVLEFTITKTAAAITMNGTNVRTDVTTAGTDEDIYVNETVTANGIIQRPAKLTLTVARTGTNVASGRKFAFRYRGY